MKLLDAHIQTTACDSFFKVSSVAGNETRSAKLSVVELPFAPTNVQAKRLGEPNQRVVQRREVSEIEISGPLPDNLQNWITEMSNISANAKSIQIKNLKAATSYQFRVSAVNRVGEGYPSEPTNTISLPHEGIFLKKM
jgi:protein sidekick